MSRKRFLRLAWAVLGLGAGLAGGPPMVVAQGSGSTAAAVAGGALGLASGATLAFVGSLVPCAQTRPGPACTRWSAIAGGGLGLTGGAMLGAGDSDRLGDVAVGSGIGFLVGAVGGLVLKSPAERFGWADVATVGLYGAAIGAAPLGSALGFAGGAAVGFVARELWDSFDSPDWIGAAVGGMALGGIAEWLIRGIGARDSEGARFRVVLPMPVDF